MKPPNSCARVKKREKEKKKLNAKMLGGKTGTGQIGINNAPDQQRRGKQFKKLEVAATKIVAL